MKRQGKPMSPKQLSEYLNVPVATLKWWRYEKRGPRFEKVGRAIRYWPADVDRWLDADNRRTA